jgi:RNA polymerase sigma-70 factor (ECF subfamily)
VYLYTESDFSGEVLLNDREWIERARRGDPAAWEALTRRHQEGVFRYAYLHLGNAQEAEDVAQEAFLRTFQSRDRLDPSRPLRPWLLSIAANLARNRRRSAGRYWAALRRFVKAQPQGAPRSGPRDPRDRKGLMAQRLWEAVQKLPGRDREVIYLRYFLEIPTVETAETLGVPEGTVKSRLARARERLRGVIEREFPSLAEEVTG